MDITNKINIELVADGYRPAYAPEHTTNEDILYAESLGLYFARNKDKGRNLFVRDKSILKDINSQKDLGIALGYICAKDMKETNFLFNRYNISVRGQQWSRYLWRNL